MIPVIPYKGDDTGWTTDDSTSSKTSGGPVHYSHKTFTSLLGRPRGSKSGPCPLSGADHSSVLPYHLCFVSGRETHVSPHTDEGVVPRHEQKGTGVKTYPDSTHRGHSHSSTGTPRGPEGETPLSPVQLGSRDTPRGRCPSGCTPRIGVSSGRPTEIYPHLCVFCPNQGAHHDPRSPLTTHSLVVPNHTP